MIKIAHISDTHIHNLKYHKEYREVFKQLFEKLEELKPDVIIHTGDIAHSKTTLSPEFVEICSFFLSGLSRIAPTRIILGNHDGNLRNSSRQDAISPIVEALKLSNFAIWKNAGEYVWDKYVTFNVLSVFDKENWVAPPSDPAKINIALHHGAISGVKTDLGWKMEHGENDISIFRGFDYGLLGDIHKTNQILDKKGKIRYAGSTVQQNHGETNDKGFLFWEIDGKDDYKCTHHKLLNPKPFVSIVLTPKGQLPKGTSVQEGARLRLVAENPLSLDRIRRSLDIAQKRFKPEAITFLSRAESKGSVEGIEGFEKEDLRDLAIQEKLIREFLKEYNVSPEIMDRALALNAKYDNLVQSEGEVSRNVDFEILELEWDNLFAYGKGNHFKFEDKAGIVGLFGKSYSGKSSVIDSLLFTLYGSISKRVPGGKIIHCINNSRDYGRGKVKLKIGHKIFTIERKAEKYTKRLGGKETIEAKTILDFDVYDEATQQTESLNGRTRNETDRNIQKYFGTLDDFMITSLSSQFRSLDFIDTKSTGRKEILAKFLDLEPFEKKFSLAKEDSKDLRSFIRRYEERDFDEEILEAKKELQFNQDSTDEKVKEKEVQEQKRKRAYEKEQELGAKIKNAPTLEIDISQIRKDKKTAESRLADAQATKKHIEKTLEALNNDKQKITSFLKDFDRQSLVDKHTIITEELEKLEDLTKKIEKEASRLKVLQAASSSLDNVPCGDQFPQCPFIREAHKARKELKEIQSLIDDKTLQFNKAKQKVEKLNPEDVDDALESLKRLEESLDEKTKEEERQKMRLVLAESNIEVYELKVADYEREENYYEEHKELIEDLESVKEERRKTSQDLLKARLAVESLEEEITALHRKYGQILHKIDTLEETKKELTEARSNFEAYDLFLRSMHSNGISFDIIKKSLPAVNAELSKVLTSITNFTVFFENEENRLNIYIQRPGDAFPTPLELAAGTEKELCAMSIRLALLNVSTLPRGDVFFLDEPGTMLDEYNTENFIRILDIIKHYFKCVLLISHIPNIKDAADTQIYVEKQKNFATLNI